MLLAADAHGAQQKRPRDEEADRQRAVHFSRDMLDSSSEDEFDPIEEEALEQQNEEDGRAAIEQMVGAQFAEQVGVQFGGGAMWQLEQWCEEAMQISTATVRSVVSDMIDVLVTEEAQLMDKKPTDTDGTSLFRRGVFQCFTCIGCHGQWSAPGQATTSIVLPTRVNPGSTFIAKLPGGAEKTLTFPEGMAAGDTFVIDKTDIDSVGETSQGRLRWPCLQPDLMDWAHSCQNCDAHIEPTFEADGSLRFPVMAGCDGQPTCPCVGTTTRCGNLVQFCSVCYQMSPAQRSQYVSLLKEEEKLAGTKQHNGQQRYAEVQVEIAQLLDSTEAGQRHDLRQPHAPRLRDILLAADQSAPVCAAA
eukprot:SAG11_NODE_7130_length_1189_cov_1.170642_2_plen_359_part_01